MKVTVLGSGTAIIRKERSSPSFLIEAGKKLLLLDCGWGVPVNFLKTGYVPLDLDHIFITHRHADHIGTLMNFIQSMLVENVYNSAKRKKPLYLHGYPGFKKDYEVLRDLICPERKETYPIKIFEYTNHQRQLGAIKIEGYKVKHVPFFNAAAFRVEYEGKIVAYSGDSTFDKNLFKVARNADLALFEASVSPKMFRQQGPRPNHLSAYEDGIIAAKVGVKRMLLWHLYDNAAQSEIRKDVRKNFKGGLIIPQDFQVINI